VLPPAVVSHDNRHTGGHVVVPDPRTVEAHTAEPTHSAVFGSPLSVGCIAESGAVNGIPSVLYYCCNYVERHGVDTEGVYRVPGDVKALHGLRDAWDTDVGADPAALSPSAQLYRRIIEDAGAGSEAGNAAVSDSSSVFVVAVSGSVFPLPLSPLFCSDCVTRGCLDVWIPGSCETVPVHVT
jgi:hypothetical protein